MKDPILCYVNPPWAYFTYKTLKEQTGDDWNDAPYSCNAGEPYGDTIVKVAYETPCYETPEDLAYNSPYSVDMINAGACAWFIDRYTGKPPISAGTPLDAFRLLIKSSGGKVYMEVI